MLAPLLIAAALAAEPAAEAAPPAQEIAAGVTLLPGGFLPGRGPDGNTVIFEGRDGLIVVDTGRHAWHSDAILGFARERQRPIAAILNTHWHLDHSSGNGRLKAAFPNARLYTTSAIDRALGEDGFLVRNLGGAEAMLADPDIPASQREEVQIFIDTMAARDGLRPDVVVARSERMRIAGRRLDLRVTRGAVTDADLWIYDRSSRVAVIGDLVTLPAPFFETACPRAWRAALDEVWDTPFRLVVPGHGPVMSREQFGQWRAAYGAFVDCVGAETEVAQCASAWTEGVRFFLSDERAVRQSTQMAEYYVGYLRQSGGKSPDCLTS